VSIPVLATGAHHRPATISIESLVISDDKKPVSGASLQQGADLPLELGVLLDTSNSQRLTHLNDIAQAANQFVTAAVRGPEDRLFLLSFEVNSHATEWFKRDQIQRARLSAAIGGGTALYDALHTACGERFGPRKWQKQTRRILVLISDGEDNASRTTRDDAIAEAVASGVLIFAIDTAPQRTLPSNGEKVMEYMAKLTGGEYYHVAFGIDVARTFATIEQLINGMYYLSYSPPEASEAIHEVEVRPAPKQKLELTYARKYLWSR
jgi:Ca-activated chloride channel homolog